MTVTESSFTVYQLCVVPSLHWKYRQTRNATKTWRAFVKKAILKNNRHLKRWRNACGKDAFHTRKGEGSLNIILWEMTLNKLIQPKEIYANIQEEIRLMSIWGKVS